jgi:hypothetical protein
VHACDYCAHINKRSAIDSCWKHCLVDGDAGWNGLMINGVRVSLHVLVCRQVCDVIARARCVRQSLTGGTFDTPLSFALFHAVQGL